MPEKSEKSKRRFLLTNCKKTLVWAESDDYKTANQDKDPLKYDIL